MAATDDRLRPHGVARMVELQHETSCVQHGGRGISESDEWSGHAEWTAAHLADMNCPKFEVEVRPKDVQHVKLQCVVDAKSHNDHLISLSSPSSVEMNVAGLTLWWQDIVWRDSVGWSPTDRQLADALTKDCVAAMDMLQSCLEQGEYQLSPEQTMLQRAADERVRRKHDTC